MKEFGQQRVCFRRPSGAGARRPGRRRPNNPSPPSADHRIALAPSKPKPVNGTQHWLVLNRPLVTGLEVTGENLNAVDVPPLEPESSEAASGDHRLTPKGKR